MGYVTEATGKQFGVIMEPIDMEHNVQAQIEKSGFIPKVVVTAEPRDPREDCRCQPRILFSTRRRRP